MKDLAPSIYRQRLVIEGKPKQAVDRYAIKEYLSLLSGKLDMNTLLPPVTHLSRRFGWAGWIHWESSGAHFYAWKKPKLFFSVDIYTCKKFDNKIAVEFTREYFNAKQIVHKSF